MKLSIYLYNFDEFKRDVNGINRIVELKKFINVYWKFINGKCTKKMHLIVSQVFRLKLIIITFAYNKCQILFVINSERELHYCQIIKTTISNLIFHDTFWKIWSVII